MVILYIYMVGGLEHLDYFSIQMEIVIPTDFHIFQRGRYTTNQKIYETRIKLWLLTMVSESLIPSNH